MENTIEISYLQLADLFFNFDNGNIRDYYASISYNSSDTIIHGNPLKDAVKDDAIFFLEYFGQENNKVLFNYLVDNYLER